MNEILLKIKKRADENQKNRQDPRFIKTIGVLKALGFLKTNLLIAPLKGVQLDAADAFWVGENVEPRVLEVLPAALIRRPKVFYNLEALPRDFLQCVAQLKRRQSCEFRGITGLDRWLSLVPEDGRFKQTIKSTCTFRLKPKTIEKLRLLVQTGQYTTMTEAIELLIEKA